MKIELQLAKATYLAGEAINVDVYVTNTGSTAVSIPLPGEPPNWQPTYTLTGLERRRRARSATGQ